MGNIEVQRAQVFVWPTPQTKNRLSPNPILARRLLAPGRCEGHTWHGGCGAAVYVIVGTGSMIIMMVIIPNLKMSIAILISVFCTGWQLWRVAFFLGLLSLKCLES